MKFYKLSQGSTFENLKHFMYLTNEYGVPSAEFIDAFIEQFGDDILSGKFTFEEHEWKQLDELWKDIVDDCKSNNVEYNKNYGSLFYYVLGTIGVEVLVRALGEPFINARQNDKLTYIKWFIGEFDSIVLGVIVELSKRGKIYSDRQSEIRVADDRQMLSQL